MALPRPVHQRVTHAVELACKPEAIGASQQRIYTMQKAHSISWQLVTLLLFGLLIVLLVVINFALGVFRMATSTGLPSPMVTFVSKQFNVSIDYPQKWAAFELTQGSH